MPVDEEVLVLAVLASAAHPDLRHVRSLWSGRVGGEEAARLQPPFVVADHDRFAKLVAHLFSMRRKTLGRSLRGQLTPAQLTAAGIDPMARPETLAPAQFALLSSLL